MNNLQSLQETLNKSKKMIKNLDQRFKEHDNKIKLNKLNEEYKQYCSKFSPAYLSGSPWYVGENLFDNNTNNYISNIAFLYGCFLNKTNK